MIRVTSPSEPLFSIGLGLVKVHDCSNKSFQFRFSSGLFFVILKNTVRVWLRFGKNCVKPIYKTPVRVRFDSLGLSLQLVGRVLLEFRMQNGVWRVRTRGYYEVNSVWADFGASFQVVTPRAAL